MNTYLKITSAAALSVVTLSVAALSVPSIKAHALKLIEEVTVKLAYVEHVTVKKEGVVGAQVVGEVLQIASNDLKLVEIPSASEEKGDAGLAAAVGAGMSSNQPSMRGGSGMTGVSSGLSSPNGLAVAGLAPNIASRAGGGIMGGRGAGPASAGAPGLEAGAPVEDVPSLIPEQILDNGDEPRAPLDIAAPGGPGVGEPPYVGPPDDKFPDMADLPPQPGIGPDGLDAVLPIAQDVGAFAQIPEPGTLALLGVALLSVGAFRRRRANR